VRLPSSEGKSQADNVVKTQKELELMPGS